jgi:M6 family metalloprotease-like protein
MMVDGKLLKNGTFGSIREYVDSPTKYNWLVHESGHLLGLIHPFNNSGKFYSGYVIPAWDLMGDAATPTAEFLAWSKNLMGWLDSAQVNCLIAEDKSTTTHLITPLSENAVGTKAVFVKISDTQVLVIENRRASQLDAVKRDQEGVLVYVVDGSIENNLGAVTFLFSKLTTTSDYRLIGTLQPGAGVKYKNVNVKVLSSAVSGDFVSLEIG